MTLRVQKVVALRTSLRKDFILPMFTKSCKNWLILLLPLSVGSSLHAQNAGDSAAVYESRAKEVMQQIQQTFYDPSSGLYFNSTTERRPAFMWGNGVMFSALVGACRYEPETYGPIMNRFFKAMDAYWDSKDHPPGYEPAPTRGNGNDKYYDDNEWMVLTFAEAYQLTSDQQYLQRAQAALKFSLSGWDEQLGGGIWWHETHKGGGKNTCSNAPAAVGCLSVARFLLPSESKSAVEMAAKIVAWTTKHLQNNSGLFGDSETVASAKKNGDQLTYNTALMIRANLGLYRWTGKKSYLVEANREAKASDWFLDARTGAYRDSVKWSHLMVEADLQMYRATHDSYLLTRAKNNANHFFAAWKAHPPAELIDNASIARMLWLLTDAHSEKGRRFWNMADQAH